MQDQQKTSESDRERFEKDLAALLVVPKREVEKLEAERAKKSRKSSKE
jgi:hypothetical protein